jgi:hypothetical protein
MDLASSFVQSKEVPRPAAESVRLPSIWLSPKFIKVFSVVDALEAKEVLEAALDRACMALGPGFGLVLEAALDRACMALGPGFGLVAEIFPELTSSLAALLKSAITCFRLPRGIFVLIGTQ